MSYRSDSLGGYDHTLLSSVPDPTRAEKQEGYNVGLLEESRDRRAPSPPTNGAASSDHNGGAVLDYSPGAVSYARKETATTTAAAHDYEPVEKRVPWYRTRKGIIGIVIAVVIIIAAAVGGGVGGSSHKGSTQNNSSSSNSTNSANTSQGVGQAPAGTGLSQQTITAPSSSSTSSLGVQNVPQQGQVGARGLAVATQHPLPGVQGGA